MTPPVHKLPSIFLEVENIGKLIAQTPFVSIPSV